MSSKVPTNGTGPVEAPASQVKKDVPRKADASSSFDLRLLDPRQMRLFRVGGVTRLTLEGDRSWTKVSVSRAFPLSDPDHYLGFLDGAGKDVGMLEDPDQLTGDSRRIMDEELEKRYFVPVVERVLTVKEEYGTIYWTVETDRGRKDIVIRNVRDNIQELSASRILLTDVDGNRFEFPDIGKLDLRSQGILMRNL